MSVETAEMLSCRHRTLWILRLRIMRAVAQGSSIRGAARRFAVSPSAAIKLMQRVRNTHPMRAVLAGHATEFGSNGGNGQNSASLSRPRAVGVSNRRDQELHAAARPVDRDR